MENEKGSGIHISGVTGEVAGVIQGGTGNIAGKNVVVGSGTINASEQQIAKIPSEYAQSLRTFSENINKQLQGSQIPQDQVESLKQSINNLLKNLKISSQEKNKRLTMKSRRTLKQKLEVLYKEY